MLIKAQNEVIYNLNQALRLDIMPSPLQKFSPGWLVYIITSDGQEIKLGRYASKEMAREIRQEIYTGYGIINHYDMPNYKGGSGEDERTNI